MSSNSLSNLLTRYMFVGKNEKTGSAYTIFYLLVQYIDEINAAEPCMAFYLISPFGT
jgi:hypothetical protein